MKYLFFFIIASASFICCDNSDTTNPNSVVNPVTETEPDTIRFASYNVSMYGNEAGEIEAKLQNGEQHLNLRKLAAVIKNVRPDVLVLMEVDYDSENKILQLFNDNLLNKDLDGFTAINYPYKYQIATNTGELSTVDIDGNGSISLPNDAYGFGNYSGQYASAILSKFPINSEDQRSFKNFLWKDMPNAVLPKNTDGTEYYSDEVIDVFRLSSKNHIDLPIQIKDDLAIHALISHPTPPVFDGDEDRNGRRNHDEIKLWADYISNKDYLMDDAGKAGGLQTSDKFIIFGDLNADPVDGDSYNNAISQLLDHELVNSTVSRGNLRPRSNGGAEHNQKAGDTGDPAYDTSFFGLSIDYVLPSSNLEASDSGVFWPASNEEGAELVKENGASDHLLVWLDIIIK